MHGLRGQLLIVMGLVAVLSPVGLAQTEIGGWRVQGVVHRRGAERADDAIDVTLAIFGDGTYVASTFLACDNGAFYCEPGTWKRGKRGRFFLSPAFPIEYDPPQELILARCLFNPFLTTDTNRPRVKKYRHVATLGSDGRLSIQTTAKVSVRFVFGRETVRAIGPLVATALPLDDALSFLREVDCIIP